MFFTVQVDRNHHSLIDLAWHWYLLAFLSLLQYFLGESWGVFFQWFDTYLNIFAFKFKLPNIITLKGNRNRNSSNKMAWQCWLPFRKKSLFFNNFILNQTLLPLDFEYLIFLFERLMLSTLGNCTAH